MAAPEYMNDLLPSFGILSSNVELQLPHIIQQM